MEKLTKEEIEILGTWKDQCLESRRKQKVESNDNECYVSTNCLKCEKLLIKIARRNLQ
jgi:hypothetical protein